MGNNSGVIKLYFINDLYDKRVVLNDNKCLINIENCIQAKFFKRIYLKKKLKRVPFVELVFIK